MKSKIVVSSALAMVMSAGAVSAQTASIVPDGTTDTNVSVLETGEVLVDLAGADASGTSLNRFDRFNVTEAGALLDNRFVGAQTILNEVTGTDPSLIEGSIEVLGAAANVILANPNGITVDGAEFINTGGVVLTTGQTSFIERTLAPGITQLNPQFDVSDGTITVGPDGLFGAFEMLHLIAREIRVDGEIAVESEFATGGVFLTAGASVAEVDAGALPFGTLGGFVTTVSKGAASDGEVLIDIARAGGLSGNTIQALVTDQGAGVRYAGDGLAGFGEFTIRADGRVELAGAQVTSSLQLSVDAGVIVASPSDRQTQLAAVNAGLVLTAEAGDVALEDTLLFTGEGQDISVTATQGGVVFAASDLELGFDLISGGDVSIAAGGVHTVDGGALQVGGDYVATVDEAFAFTSSDAVISGDAVIAAGAVVFDSPDTESSFASLGTVQVTATADSILINGALVQGAATNAGPTGLFFNAANDILINTLDVDRRGVLFTGSGDLSLAAGGDIINTSGRLISNADILIAAGGRFDNQLGTLTQSGEELLADALAAGSSSGSFDLDFGPVPGDDIDAVLTAQGNITISAGEILRNFGGEFNANEGDIRLDAEDVILQSRVFGEASSRRSCFIICRVSGESSVETIGGELNASGSVIIESETSFLNLGGFLTALDGIEIDAANITFEALLLPDFITRPGGLHNFFTGASEIVLWRDVLGGVFSGEGEIVLTSASPVRLIGVTLDDSALTAPGGLDTSEQDRTVSPILNDEIGLFGLGF